MEKLLALSIGTHIAGENGFNIQAPSVLPQGDILRGILTNAVSLLIIAAIVISLFFIILSGIRWTTSGGDEKQVEAAKGTLKYAIIGLIIALSSFFIIQIVGNFFGVGNPLGSTGGGRTECPAKPKGKCPFKDELWFCTSSTNYVWSCQTGKGGGR